MTSRVCVAAAVVLAGAVVGLGNAGSAIADPGGITLRYQCSMPLFPEQPMTVRLTWNAPESVPVGRKTPIVPVKAVATMGAAVTQGLGVVSATTVEGSADATGVVAAPEGNTEAGVPLTVPRTKVPESGPITVVASGVTPQLVFHRPGHATITVGREFAVHLVPKTADGGTTIIGPVDASCALDPGQHTVLTSFEITAPPRGKTHGRQAGPATATGPATSRAPVAARPHESTAAQVSVAAARSSQVSPAGNTSAAAKHGTAFTTVRTAGLAAVIAPWLVSGTILIVVVVLGCVWLLRRRHRRAGPGQVDSL